ncbi:hypothetical protein ACQP1V_36250 [Microtetraspora malaysiensis]|uniref:hypothetical protein n=1 Tax=Microtetraspora malaysiensis TaxID=161358 RepID=UPI003D90E0F1
MAEIKMTHPEIEGAEIDVPESSVPFHHAAGWVLANPDTELTQEAAIRHLVDAGYAPEAVAAVLKGGQGDAGDPGAEGKPTKDTTPKGRRGTEKDGD